MPVMPIPEINAPLIIPRGDHHTYRCTVVDKDGAVVPIIGATIYFSVRREFESDLLILKKSTADPTEIEITNGLNGEFKLYLVPVDTEDMADTYKFTFAIILATGKRASPMIGDFIVQKTVKEV